MNKKNVKSSVLLFLGHVCLFALASTVYAASVEKLEWAASHPIQSEEVDIDVAMDKDSYFPGEIPKISITAYNRTDSQKQLNVLLAVFRPDGTGYSYPSKLQITDAQPWQPWLPSHPIPANYELPFYVETEIKEVPELTSGKWHVGVILQDPNSENIVSFKVHSFTLDIPPVGMLGIWNYDLPDEGKDSFAMIFVDGSMTNDMATVLNKNIDISKASNVKKWGNWSFVPENPEVSESNKVLEYTFGKESFKPENFSQIKSGEADHRLDGCFGSIKKGTNHDKSFLKTNPGYCFKTDATFDHSSSDLNSDTWGTKPKQSGQYRIDGNVITLTYGDGFVQKAGFGFLNQEHTEILINLNRLPQQ
jgi:hypothetical protein